MDRNTWYMRPDLPTMGAWNAKNQLSEEYFLMERNPYFFQVDAEGQQLPYVDRITHHLHSSADVFAMWVINGEIDFSGRQLTTTNYTLYKENEEKGDYKVVFAMDSMHRVLHLNMTTADARTREFLATATCASPSLRPSTAPRSPSWSSTASARAPVQPHQGLAPVLPQAGLRAHRVRPGPGQPPPR